MATVQELMLSDLLGEEAHAGDRSTNDADTLLFKVGQQLHQRDIIEGVVAV